MRSGRPRWDINYGKTKWVIEGHVFFPRENEVLRVFSDVVQERTLKLAFDKLLVA